MKKLQLALLMLCLIAIHTTSCKKDKSNVLPDETQEGNNILAFLLDGRAWTSDGPYGLTMGSANKLNLSIRASVGIQYIPNVNFNIKNTPIKTDTVYLLSSKSDLNFGEYCESTMDGDTYHYFTNDKYTGSVTLTKFDTINKIVSGRFSFKAKREISGSKDCKCDTVISITDGRFDFKYVKEYGK